MEDFDYRSILFDNWDIVRWGVGLQRRGTPQDALTATKGAYFLLDPLPIYDIPMTTSLNAITGTISALKISELLS